MSSPTRGREPEDDSTTGDDPDRALRELLEHEHGACSSVDVPSAVEAREDLTLLAGWQVKQPKPPAVLCIRAVDFREPLVGRRARFWLTSFDESDDLITLGWRDGLRIVSEVQDLRGEVARVVEPTVSVQEEADYYRALTGEKNTMRFAAGLSRIWVEQYVTQPNRDDETAASGQATAPSSNAWLSDVVEDQGAPRLIRPVPARAVHALTGRRVIHVAGDGTATTDQRAVGEPSWTADGTIVVPVIDEHDWYLWTMRSNMRHPSLRAVEISSLWVEA